MKNIADNIMMLREREGISQEEFADKLEVSRQTVYKWENGMSVPSVENIKRICEIFNCEFASFCLDKVSVQSKEQDVVVDFNDPAFYESIWFEVIEDVVSSKFEDIESVLVTHNKELEMDKDDIRLIMSCITSKYFFPEIVLRNIHKFKGQKSAEEILDSIEVLAKSFSDKLELFPGVKEFLGE